MLGFDHHRAGQLQLTGFVVDVAQFALVRDAQHNFGAAIGEVGLSDVWGCGEVAVEKGMARLGSGFACRHIKVAANNGVEDGVLGDLGGHGFLPSVPVRRIET